MDLRDLVRNAIAAADARNVGLDHATGDLITFLDQDDLWPANRTRLLVDALKAAPEAEIAAGLVEMRYERRGPSDPRENLKTMHRELLLGSLCVRRGLFDRLGPFSSVVGYGDDSDFWLRRRDAGVATLFIDEVTLVYRLHAANTSIDKTVSNYNFLAVLRESLKRRRAAR